MFQFDSYAVYTFGHNHLIKCSIKGKGVNIVFTKNIVVCRGKTQLNVETKLHSIEKFCSNRDHTEK